MFMVERRAPSGTTGILRSLLVERREKLLLEGVDPRAHVAHRAVAEEGHGAVRHLALVSISAHRTPRCPGQMRSLFKGSGMMTWSTLGFEGISPSCEVGDAAEAARFLVDRSGYLDGAGKSGLTSMKASAAMIEAASLPFMSQRAAAIDPARP